MARLLVEESRSASGSDGEFPELADLLQSKLVAGRTKEASSANGATQKSNLSTQPKRKESRKNETRMEGVHDGDNIDLGREKPKPRRRLLTTTNNNPLLRPITSTTGAGKPPPPLSEARRKALVPKKSVAKPKQATENAASIRAFKTLEVNTMRKMTEEGKAATNNKVTQRETCGRSIEALQSPEAELRRPAFFASTVSSSRKKAVESESVEESDLSLQPPKFMPKKKIGVPKKTVSSRALEMTSEEDFSEEESGSLSEFIVGDESEIEEPPRKSTRRLVRGRRRVSSCSYMGETSIMGELVTAEEHMSKPTRDQIVSATLRKPFEASLSDWDDSETEFKIPSPVIKPILKSAAVPDEKRPQSSDIDLDFGLLKFSPPTSRKVSKEIRFRTPPPSPLSKPRLASPKKLPRIPSTPHRQSTDAFWSAAVVNDWNDEFSPVKALPPPSPKKKLFSPTKPKTDLAVKKDFEASKHELAESFLAELDEKITSGEIARLSASTGGVKLIWSKTLNTTAGRANWKRETIKTTSSSTGAVTLTYRHHASIELASKVLSTAEQLLNVVAHEYCHLANFMVSNIKTNPHGKEFKAWAAKVSKMFGTRGIEVTTKHSYEIEYKYIWACEECAMEFGRHSKSIDVKKHGCGACKGRLVQIKPVPRVAKEGAKEGEKVVGDYQKFFKENLKKVKEELPAGSPHKEVMGEVGRRYQIFKAEKLKDEDTKVPTKDTSEVDVMESVARKLEFLDLTSP